MADPYWKYVSTGTDPRAAFPGYISSDGPSVASHAPYSTNNRIPSDLLQSSSLRSGAYNIADPLANTGSRPMSGIGGLPAGAPGIGVLPTGTLGSGALPAATPGISRMPGGASLGAVASLHDPALVRREASIGVTPGIPDLDRSTPLIKSESLHGEESNMLYVDGLPSDCTRREVGHLFRPFIGFKEIRLYHKEPRRTGDKARVLCFVEFSDTKCAMTALDALQGYKFDDRKPDAPILRIQFAHFPLRLPS